MHRIILICPCIGPPRQLALQQGSVVILLEQVEEKRPTLLVQSMQTLFQQQPAAQAAVTLRRENLEPQPRENLEPQPYPSQDRMRLDPDFLQLYRAMHYTVFTQDLAASLDALARFASAACGQAAASGTPRS